MAGNVCTSCLSPHWMPTLPRHQPGWRSHRLLSASSSLNARSPSTLLSPADDLQRIPTVQGVSLGDVRGGPWGKVPCSSGSGIGASNSRWKACWRPLNTLTSCQDLPACTELQNTAVDKGRQCHIGRFKHLEVQ